MKVCLTKPFYWYCQYCRYGLVFLTILRMIKPGVTLNSFTHTTSVFFSLSYLRLHLSITFAFTYTHTHTPQHKNSHIVACCFWLVLLCSWCENTGSQVDRKRVCCLWGGWSHRWLTEPLRTHSCFWVVKNTWGCSFYSFSLSPQRCFLPRTQICLSSLLERVVCTAQRHC